MDVRLPDGTIIANVPDGTTKADLVTKLKGNGMAVPSEWLAAEKPVEPTARERLLSSAPMRLAKGGKDPIDGAAQLLQHLLPSSAVNAVNKFADMLGGEGTFAGDVLGIKGATPNQLSQDIRSSESEYQQARQATARGGAPGMDIMRFTGNVVSPVNAGVARVLPVAAASNGVGVLAAKGALSGAAGAATQPVMGDDYALEKATQVGVGAATGGVMAPVVSKIANSVATAVRNLTRAGSPKTPEAIAMEVKASLARDDIDLSQIPKAMMDKLNQEAQQAMQTGKQIDPAAMLRKLDFEQAGVKPLTGQITRDPTQYTKELNLRGIQGVGEPIANRLNEQQGAISSKFRQATSGAKSPYEAGQTLVEGLQKKDAAMSADVRKAYTAFKESTGKDLEVPLGGLAQDYSKTLRDFGETIPGAVRRQFEELGLLTGKQTKNLSIVDAENLIKTINKNYNPADKAQATALNELRGHVQNAILNVTDTGEGMEAAALANMARDTAKKRFQAIDSVPALKAAINSAEPDDFVKKYVINGKVRELNEMSKLLGPDEQKVMSQQMLKYLEGKAFGANAAGDGSGRQASFNQELQNIGRNKLAALLGEDKTNELFQLGRVMAYIQQRPAGSAVNESNTGAAIASLVGKLGGSIKGAPYINDFVVKPIQGFQDRGAVKNALAAMVPNEPAKLDPQTVNRLAQLLGPVPQASGTALGYSVR